MRWRAVRKSTAKGRETEYFKAEVEKHNEIILKCFVKDMAQELVVKDKEIQQYKANMAITIEYLEGYASSGLEGAKQALELINRPPAKA